MAFFNWNETYSVGVEEIDNQHKELVNILNRLFDAMSVGKAHASLGKIINEMIRYAGVHFATEENYFDEFDFELADEHKVEHQKFVDDVLKFQDGFNSGNIVLSVEVFRFLKNWLTTHMLGSDQKYKQCFRENGLK